MAFTGVEKFLAAMTSCWVRRHRATPRKKPGLPGLQILGQAAAAAWRRRSSARASRSRCAHSGSAGVRPAVSGRDVPGARAIGRHAPDVVAVVEQHRFAILGPAGRAVGGGVLGVSVSSFRNFTAKAGGQVHRLAVGHGNSAPQGERRRGNSARRGAVELDSSACRVAERDDGSQRIPLQPEDGPLSRRGVHLYAERKGGGGSSRGGARWTSPTPFIPTLATRASVQRSTAAWWRCAPSCARATSSRLSRRKITSRAATGSRYAFKSPRARNKIKHWLNEDQRLRAVDIGRKLLEREARKFKVPMAQIGDQDLGRIAQEFGVATAADLLATLGQGKNSAHQLLGKLAPGFTAPPETEPSTAPKSGEAAMTDAVRRLHIHRFGFAASGGPERSACLSRTMLQPHSRQLKVFKLAIACSII